jgi:hypothetical protein
MHLSFQSGLDRIEEIERPTEGGCGRNYRMCDRYYLCNEESRKGKCSSGGEGDELD